MSSVPPIQISSKEQFQSILDSIDYVLTDCDGVLYRDGPANPIDGASQFISRLKQVGKKVIYVTNNSSVRRSKVVQKLNEWSFHAEVDDVFTSGSAVANHFKKNNFSGKVYVVGCEGLASELNDASVECTGVGPTPFPDVMVPEIVEDTDVKGVIVSYDNMITMPKLIAACTYASRVDPLFFVVAEPDASITKKNGQIIPTAGSMGALVERATGRKGMVIGKPEKLFFQTIVDKRPDLKPERTLMIGDRLVTDIAFGRNNDVRYTLLVGSGVNKLEDAVTASKTPGQERYVPTHYAPSLDYLNQFF